MRKIVRPPYKIYTWKKYQERQNRKVKVLDFKTIWEKHQEQVFGRGINFNAMSVCKNDLLNRALEISVTTQNKQ